MTAEEMRLKFMGERDGKDAAVAFANQMYSIYRKAIPSTRPRSANKMHFASLPEYRRSFIESCVVLHQHLGNNR